MLAWFSINGKKKIVSEISGNFCWTHFISDHYFKGEYAFEFFRKAQSEQNSLFCAFVLLPVTHVAPVKVMSVVYVILLTISGVQASMVWRDQVGRIRWSMGEGWRGELAREVHSQGDWSGSLRVRWSIFQGCQVVHD